MPVLSLQPLKRKGLIWPLFFILLGATSDCKQWHALEETLSVHYLSYHYYHTIYHLTLVT